MKIGIIGAFNEEIDDLVIDLKLKKCDERQIYSGIYKNNEIVCANSGIGKVNSSSMCQYLIDKYNVNIIINSGCAGSLVESVKIMDIVISETVTYHDFMPVRVMRYSTPDNGNIKADIKLKETVLKVLENLNIKNYHIGTIASGDSFVTDNNMRDRIYNETKALAVDMESGSIAHVSKLNNIPFIAIRTISDFADGNDDFEIEAAKKSSKIVKDLIDTIINNKRI